METATQLLNDGPLPSRCGKHITITLVPAGKLKGLERRAFSLSSSDMGLVALGPRLNILKKYKLDPTEIEIYDIWMVDELPETGEDLSEIPVASLADLEEHLNAVLSGDIDPRDSMQLRYSRLSKPAMTKTHGSMEVVKFDLVAYYAHPGELAPYQTETEALAGAGGSTGGEAEPDVSAVADASMVKTKSGGKSRSAAVKTNPDKLRPSLLAHTLGDFDLAKDFHAHKTASETLRRNFSAHKRPACTVLFPRKGPEGAPYLLTAQDDGMSMPVKMAALHAAAGAVCLSLMTGNQQPQVKDYDFNLQAEYGSSLSINREVLEEELNRPHKLKLAEWEEKQLQGVKAPKPKAPPGFYMFPTTPKRVVRQLQSYPSEQAANMKATFKKMKPERQAAHTTEQQILVAAWETKYRAIFEKLASKLGEHGYDVRLCRPLILGEPMPELIRASLLVSTSDSWQQAGGEVVVHTTYDVLPSALKFWRMDITALKKQKVAYLAKTKGAGNTPAVPPLINGRARLRQQLPGMGLGADVELDEDTGLDDLADDVGLAAHGHNPDPVGGSGAYGAPADTADGSGADELALLRANLEQMKKTARKSAQRTAMGVVAGEGRKPAKKQKQGP